MRINAVGQAVSGFSGRGIIAVDGVVPAALASVTGGGPQWLTDSEIVYVREVVRDEHYIIEAFDLNTKQSRMLANRGAAVLRCDGEGRYATWDPSVGVMDEHDRRWPKAALLDYDHGILVICPDHQSGMGIELWRDGQLIQSLTVGPLGADAVTGRETVLRAGLLAYGIASRWSVIGGSKPYVKPSYAVAMVPVPLPDGRYAVLEHDASRLYLRWPDDTSKGLLLSTSGEHHAIDARCVDGAITVAWWTGPGCLPHEYRSAVISIASIGADTITPAPTPVQAIAPNIPSVQLSGTWAAAHDAPGNLAIGSRTYPLPEHTAVIAGDDTIDAIPTDRRAGLLVYCSGDDEAAIRALIARCIPIAAAHRVPMFVYDDRRVGRFALAAECCGSAPWVWMPQWYLSSGEDPQAFARSMVSLASTFGGHAILPVIRAYTSWRGLDDQGRDLGDAVPESAVVVGLNALIEHGALQIPGFTGWIFFAWDRADGITHRPIVKSATDRWMRVTSTVTNARAWASAQFSPEVPMSNVPDYSGELRDLYNTGAFRLDSHDGCGIFTDAAARCLHAIDPEIGHLIKRPGQNQYPAENGHAVDAILHRSAGRSIDIIEKSETAEARPGWGVDDPRYSPSDWRAPLPQPMSKVQRPDLPFVLGMTAFDACTLTLADLKAWLALHIEFKLPYLRIIHQSVFRTPRTLEKGLEQLDWALPIIADHGLGALVSLNCDTKEYSMDRAAVIANTLLGHDILLKHVDKFGPLMLLPDLGNEVQNGNEQPFMMDPFFLLELDALIDPRFPLGWAPMFGTDIAPAASGGSWIPHHSDRGLSPDENGRIMAAAQVRYGKKVMDREPLGFAEPNTRGQRTWDVAYARALGANAKQHNLGGLIYHTEAGLRALASQFGESHRAGAVALLEGLGGALEIPPPPPAEVATFVTLRNEAIASAIDIAYATLLGRKPDPIGIGIYAQRLRSGWTVAQMEDDIKASAEYKAKAG